MDAAIYIYTYKEGLLSKLAHDLRFTLTRFEISARGTEIEATFDLSSLRVDGVMKDGKIDRSVPSESDREKIRENVRQDVLRTSELGEARFLGRTHSREPPFTVSGDLTLCGVTKPLSLLLLTRGDRMAGELEILPSQWGIKPFRALGGTLKVQDRIRIAVHANADWLATGAELNPAVQLNWRPNLAKPSFTRLSQPRES
jgi:polyisoprenoid-binding protein YceI